MNLIKTKIPFGKKVDFPGGPVVKNLLVNAEDADSIPGLEDSTCCRAAKPVLHNY